MKQFKLHHKILAVGLILIFVFTTMNEINSHTYTTGVDSYHYKCGCFGCWESHLAAKCSSENHSLFY